MMSSVFAKIPKFKDAFENLQAEASSHDLTQALQHHTEESLASVLDNDQSFFFEHYLPIMLESVECE